MPARTISKFLDSKAKSQDGTIDLVIHRIKSGASGKGLMIYPTITVGASYIQSKSTARSGASRQTEKLGPQELRVLNPTSVRASISTAHRLVSCKEPLTVGGQPVDLSVEFDRDYEHLFETQVKDCWSESCEDERDLPSLPALNGGFQLRGLTVQEAKSFLDHLCPTIDQEGGTLVDHKASLQSLQTIARNTDLKLNYTDLEQLGHSSLVQIEINRTSKDVCTATATVCDPQDKDEYILVQEVSAMIRCHVDPVRRRE